MSTGISRSADQIATLEALVPDFVPFDNTNTAHFWFVKVTAEPSAGHRVSGFYQQDTNPTLSGLAETEHPAKEARGGAAASFQVASVWSDRLMTRALASYNDKRRETKDTGIEGPLRRVFSSTILSGGLPVGNGILADLGAPDVAFMTQPNQKLTASFDATWLARRGARTHELRTGLYFQDRVEESRDTYINDGFFAEESAPRELGVLDSGLVPFHRYVFDGTDLTVLRIHSRDYAVYVQDSWRPTSRLTVNAGVRVDHIVMRDELFETTTEATTEVGPRFGINYALTRAATDVVRAHWVRVHDQPGIAAGVGTTSLGLRSLYDADLDGTFETVFVIPPTSAVTPNRRIDPDLHQPFVREWGAGYSKQVRGGVAAHLDFVHRRYVDRPTLVETNGRYDGRRFVGYVDEEFNELYTTTNNRWNTPVYSALELSLSKRSRRVQAVASYVRQWRHLDGTWQPNDEASFIQPDAFPNNRGIGGTSGVSNPSQIRSLSGSNMTQRGTASGQWQDHTMRLGVAYDGPWGLLFASSYIFQSGIWSGPVVSRIAAPDPAFGPTRVTLSNGRVVSNPLATTIRFAYPTRGEGQLKTPALHAWNVRVGRRFTVGRAALDASLDIFNLTNTGTDLSFRSGATQTYNPLFGTTEFRRLPRSAQIVLRASF